MGVGGRTLMNGGAVADNVVVATPSDPVARGVSQGWKVDPQAIVTHAEMDRLVALLSRRG